MKKTPSLKSIFNRFSSDLKQRLGIPLNDNLKENLSALGAVVSAENYLLYLLAEDIQRNLYPDTADPESEGGQLERLGLLYLGRLPYNATPTKLRLRVKGKSGSTLRDNLTFKDNNSNLLFILDNKYILNGTNDLIEVRSLENGSETVLQVGSELTITEPVIGVDSIVVVSEIIEKAVNSESESEYRRAVLDSMQLEMQGGAKTDYRLWARDCKGIRNVYPYVKSGDAGTIEIFAEANKEDSTDSKGTPPASMLSNLTSVLNLDPNTNKPMYKRGRRPMQAKLEVKPIVHEEITVTIKGLFTSSNAIKDSVKNSIEGYLYTIRPFVDGGQLLRDKNDVLNVARLSSAVSDAIGVDNFFLDLEMKVGSNIVSQWVFTNGRIPVLKNVVYVV